MYHQIPNRVLVALYNFLFAVQYEKYRMADALIKCTFLGSVNPELIWVVATPEIVTETTRQAIDILESGGELILGAGCALSAKTKPENVHGLVETAKVYEVYHTVGTLRKAEGN